jgi:glucokinase
VQNWSGLSIMMRAISSKKNAKADPMNALSAPAPRLLLAADIGGTKTLLQLHYHEEGTAGHNQPVAKQRYASSAFDSLEAMVQHFLKESGQGRPQSACFAVAGPVRQQGDEQHARLTNLPWQLSNKHLSEALDIPRITLLNDFQAIGYSLDILDTQMLTPLNDISLTPRGPQLVVGAGTGLGVCLVFPDGDHTTCYPSEGGHAAFAPSDARQSALLAFLRAQYERVSYERLLSGRGLINIYRFLLHEQGKTDDLLLNAPDPAAAIGEHGVNQPHSPAGEAAALFTRLYGAFAGDMALACIPTGGVFIAGGIAPKLLPRIQEGGFMQAFTDKGRMSGLTSTLPVSVITNPQSGLLGAAHYAARP